MAILASALAGYASGLETRLRQHPNDYGDSEGYGTLSGKISIMILLIQDLDQPGAGFIESSQQPMIDLATSIAAYAD